MLILLFAFLPTALSAGSNGEFVLPIKQGAVISCPTISNHNCTPCLHRGASEYEGGVLL